MPNSEFGPKLKSLREQAGLSQRDLARKVGINFSYLSKIENGVLPPPSQEVILKLAKALRTDSDELLTLAGKVPADIARILLKNHNVLQSLREGDVESKSTADRQSGAFNKRLKELREQAGLSQNHLAEKVGISFTYLSKIENGVRPPPSEKVITKLAEALGCNKDDLMALAGKVPSDIAGVLKSQELRQSIRNNPSGRNKILSKAEEKRGVGIMKQLLWGKNLARVALAFVLVLAVAVSLWYASPSQVKALKIDITDSNGAQLATGTLGQTYNFKVVLNVENPDLIPAAGMDINIVNAAGQIVAHLWNLPFADGSHVDYTSEQTGNGGAANVSVAQTNIQSSTGLGYVTWKGYAYRYVTPAAGYSVVTQGLPAKITYSISWTPPVSLPAGSYKIGTTVATLGNTNAGNNPMFTQLSTEFALTSGSAVDISVALQGGLRPNPDGWAIPLTVKFFSPGADVMVAQPLFSFTQTTAKSGSSAITQVVGITPGTYDVTVKSDHTLINKKVNVVVSSSPTAVDMGTLLEGNAKEDSPDRALIVDIYDFGVLSGSWLKQPGDAGYQANANFDRNSIVDIYDFGMLSGNWMKQSPVTVP